MGDTERDHNSRSREWDVVAGDHGGERERKREMGSSLLKKNYKK